MFAMVWGMTEISIIRRGVSLAILVAIIFGTVTLDPYVATTVGTPDTQCNLNEESHINDFAK